MSELVAAMSRPAFYPHRPRRVELVETHISFVFLAGDRVYKVKKPVVFPFLDYATPGRRRELCHEEVRLNRRLAADLYLGVRGLARRDGRWTLVGADDPGAEEWAVEMRRFDERHTLARLLAAGEANGGEIVKLGRLVADFHARAAVVREAGSRVEAAQRATADNFDEVGACPEAVPWRAVRAGRRFVRAFLRARGGTLEGRARAGLVRDCHGDLRAEHVIFNARVQIFDCVEFSSRLRQIDVGADLAFLQMDLVHAGRDKLARTLVSSYRGAGGDPGDDGVLSFFAAYRAWVRAKVACLRARELPAGDSRTAAALAQAGDFAATARRFEWLARGPRLVALCGGSGTGKTFLAQRLAAASGWRHLSSDVVRKELTGVAPGERAPAEAYTAEVSERTYRELARRARSELEGGRGAIVDATFRFRRDRAAFLAELSNGPRLFFECRAPAAQLAERAARRAADPGRVSDADLAQIERQQCEFEPLEELANEQHVVLRTDRQADELVDRVEEELDAAITPG